MSYKEKIHALKLISEAYAMQDEKATSTIAIKQRERRLAKKRQEEEREMMELEDDFSYQLRLYARKLDKMEEEKERVPGRSSGTASTSPCIFTSPLASS